jgi:hypothetical protein
MTDRLAHIPPLQRVFLRRARSDIPTPIEQAYWTKRRREEVESDRQQQAVDKECAIREEMRKQEIAREAARRLPATQAAADTLAPKRQPGSTLEHSDDCRIISFKGQRLHLTPGQAAIVRVLHQSPYCEASSHMIKKLTGCSQIRDSFRAGDGPKLWRRVIVPSVHPRGFYRLNLTPKN